MSSPRSVTGASKNYCRGFPAINNIKMTPPSAMGQFSSIRMYRPRCGIQDEASFRKHGIVDKYISISGSLARKAIPVDKCAPERLARIIADMRAFLDKYMGADPQQDLRNHLTVFPASVFEDFSEHGAQSCLLATCFAHAAEFELGSINFEDERKVDDYVGMLVYAKKVLKSEGHLKSVKAYIAPSVPERESEKLRNVLQNHGAAILSTPDVATHVIYPDYHGSKEHQTDDQVLVRVLRRGTYEGVDECFVHWMHHPDSFNDWIPKEDVLGHVYIPRPRRDNEQWHICSRWVRDLDAYNEWMNELDYEMPSTFDEYVGRPPLHPSSETRKLTSFSKIRLKLRITDKTRKELKLENDSGFKMVGLPTIGDQAGKENGNVDDDVIMFSDSSENSSSGIRDSEDDDINDGALSGSDKRRTREGSVREQIAVGNGVYMPSYSKWFEMKSVHEIERRALPEFFSGKFASKTENAYRDIRNFMVRTWRRNSTAYLSGTAARRHLAGDACSILRVHGLLEHWGLINYACPDAAPPPSFNPPPRPLPLHAGIEDDVAVRKSLRLLLDNGGKAELKDMKVLKYGKDGEPITAAPYGSVLIRESDKTGHSAQIAEKPAKEPIEYHCDSCGTDCSQLRFHCATKADIDLCALCYYNERYSSTMKHRDFIQMNCIQGGGEYDDADIWTESETLLLLEALEMYADNWQLVSEHVGSKGKNQCVVQFLRLPIEDSFLDNTLKRWWCEHPSQDKELPSPAEIMKEAGCRESALLAIASKGTAAKTYAGQPLVFGDQVSTIVPFASSLSSLAPPTMLKEITDGLDLENPKLHVRNPFKSFVEACFSDGLHAGEEVSLGLQRKAVTTDLYRELLRKVKIPADVLKSEYADTLSTAAYALLKHGSMQRHERTKLRFYASSCNLLRQVSSHKQMDLDTGNTSESQKSVMPNERGPSLKVSQAADATSSTAVAISSLAAAVVTAAQLRQAEDVEISRLRDVCMHTRLMMIKRKMKHLSDISEHEKLTYKYRKRRRVEDFDDRIRRKLLRIERESEMETEDAMRSVCSVDSEGLVPPLKVHKVRGSYGGIKCRTEFDGFEEILRKERLPDFSDELCLVAVDGDVMGNDSHEGEGEEIDREKGDEGDVDENAGEEDMDMIGSGEDADGNMEENMEGNAEEDKVHTNMEEEDIVVNGNGEDADGNIEEQIIVEEGNGENVDSNLVEEDIVLNMDAEGGDGKIEEGIVSEEAGEEGVDNTVDEGAVDGGVSVEGFDENANGENAAGKLEEDFVDGKVEDKDDVDDNVNEVIIEEEATAEDLRVDGDVNEENINELAIVEDDGARMEAEVEDGKVVDEGEALEGVDIDMRDVQSLQAVKEERIEIGRVGEGDMND